MSRARKLASADYTPVQYEVIASIYPCRKTILGDYNQSVNPLSASSAEAIQQILPDAECMYMHKSYRSTVEITALAQHIQRNPNLVPIERHGEPPTLISCDDAEQELRRICEVVQDFDDTSYNTLALICKTQQQAGAYPQSVWRLVGSPPERQTSRSRSTLPPLPAVTLAVRPLRISPCFHPTRGPHFGSGSAHSWDHFGPITPH